MWILRVFQPNKRTLYKDNQRTQRQTWSRPFEHNKALWATKIRSASIREQPWNPSFEATKTAAVTAVKKCHGKIWKGSTKNGIQQLRKWRLKGTFDEAGWNHKYFSWYFFLDFVGDEKVTLFHETGWHSCSQNKKNEWCGVNCIPWWSCSLVNSWISLRELMPTMCN